MQSIQGGIFKLKNIKDMIYEDLDDKNKNTLVSIISELAYSMNYQKIIVKDMLHSAALDSKSSSLVIYKPFNVNDIFINILDLQKYSKDQGLNISIKLLDEDVIVVGDELKLKRIASFLVTSSTKRTMKGNVTVKAEIVEQDSNINCPWSKETARQKPCTIIKITVTDEGPSLSETDIKNILAGRKSKVKPDLFGSLYEGYTRCNSLVKLLNGDFGITCNHDMKGIVLYQYYPNMSVYLV